jgi:hypothetical protein
MMMFFPIAVFWVLICIGRSELGFKGIVFCFVLWLCLLLGFRQFNLPSYWFTAQVLFDAILIFIIFGGDIRIR